MSDATDTNERVASEFDRVAREYETNFLSPWYKAHAVELLSAFAPGAAGTVVDVGCGTGWFLRRLCSEHRGITGVGIDISGEMIAAARDYAAQEEVRKLSFVKGDWETMNLDSISSANIGAVVCANCFHYFSRPLDAIKRMFDILEPGGRILLLERDKSTSVLTVLWDLLHRYAIRDHVRFYGYEELREHLDAAGFKSIECVCRIRRIFWKKKLYTSLVLLSARRVDDH